MPQRVATVTGSGIVALGAWAAWAYDLRFAIACVAGLLTIVFAWVGARRARAQLGALLVAEHERSAASLQSKRRACERELRELAQHKRRLVARYGGSFESAASTLAHARACMRHRAARARLDELRRHRDALQASWDEEYASLSAFLARCGIESEADWSVDEVALEAALRSSERRDELRVRLEEHDLALEAAERRVDALVAQERAIFASLDLDVVDRAAERLRKAYAELEGCRAERAQVEALTQGLADREARLAKTWSGEDLSARSESELRARRHELAALLARREDVGRQLGALEAEIGRARTGEDVARGRLAIEEASARLDERFEESLDACAAEALLARVERRTRDECRPELVEEAARLFARFTLGAWDLRVVDVEGAGGVSTIEIGAYDCRRGVLCELEELSDGTRSQLLFAVRLAVAFAAENGEAFPVVIDEALAHSDDERFAAIASCILRLAADEGRQFVLLTADAADPLRVARVAHELELPELRVVTLGEAVPDGERGAVVLPALEPRVRLDEAAAWDEEAWLRALGMPSIDPRQPVDALSLWWILMRDRSVFESLYRARVDSVGQWLALRRRGATSWIGAEDAELLDALIAVWSAWHTAWRVGRGAALDASIVASMEAIGPSFRVGVAELCRRVEGDAKALLDEIARGALPRFRRKALDQLREALRVAGLLDEREVLTPEERRAQGMAALASGCRASVVERAALLVEVLEEAALRQSAACAAAKRAPGMRKGEQLT